MFELSKTEFLLLKKLNTPEKIQDFLDLLPINYEKNGDTCMSPRMLLKARKAHCIEGAMLAAVALWLQGERPLVLNLKVKEGRGDFDHIVALYKQNGYWGAISKTNHSILRFRDPIYRTIRELALSYFHEYFLIKCGTKTLQGYSKPIDLRQFGTTWITSDQDLWNIGNMIYKMPITRIVPDKNIRYIRKAHMLERKAASIPEWKKNNKGT